ncbi:MAG: hypothetical protein QW273_03000 [Candidatus Pacearchaeota archaeon]
MEKKYYEKKKQRVSIDPVFIPLSYEEYKKGKINLLSSEIKVLESVRRINQIKEIKRQKELLRKEFYKRVEETIFLINQLKNFIPNLKKDYSIFRREKVEEKKENIYSESSIHKENEERTDKLDRELKEIQDKLNALTAKSKI